MGRRSSTEAIVELVLGLAFAIAIGLLVHYISRGRDWRRLCADDPDLYAATEGERTVFLLSAWAFPAETALLAAWFGALAVAAHPGFAVGALLFGAILIVSLGLRAREDGDVVSDADDSDFYDLAREDEQEWA